MLLTLLYSFNFILDRLRHHAIQYGMLKEEIAPDKETTCCIIILSSRNSCFGNVLEYLESKAFKIVGLKMFQNIPEVGFIEQKPNSRQPNIPTAVMAIQGKESVAMVHSYLRHSGQLCTNNQISYQTASPVFCPATVAEARDALGRLFQQGDLHDWERSADWWIVRENC